MKQFNFFLCRGLGLLLLAIVLQSCSKSTDETQPEGTPASVTGYNYTFEGIQEFYVNGAWGGGVSVGGGNGQVCCVQLPDRWTPGLTAKVHWVRSDCGDENVGGKRCPFGGDSWPHKDLEATVAIEPYDRPGDVQVMFLPKDEIKIYVFGAGPINPAHPSKLGTPRPLDHPEWKP